MARLDMADRGASKESACAISAQHLGGRDSVTRNRTKRSEGGPPVDSKAPFAHACITLNALPRLCRTAAKMFPSEHVELFKRWTMRRQLREYPSEGPQHTRFSTNARGSQTSAVRELDTGRQTQITRAGDGHWVGMRLRTAHRHDAGREGQCAHDGDMYARSVRI